MSCVFTSRIRSATLHGRDLSAEQDPSIDAVWDGFNIAAVIDAGAGAESGHRVMDTLAQILASLCRCSLMLSGAKPAMVVMAILAMVIGHV